MAPELTNETWAQIRYDYEHTERTIAEICAEHGISDGTLRDRRRRWGWTRRRPPVPRHGPPPLPAPQIEAATPSLAHAPQIDIAAAPPVRALDGAAPVPCALDTAAPLTAAPQIAPSLYPSPSEKAFTPVFDGLCGGGLGGGDAIVPRLQSAVARVLPAIETTLAKLGTGPMPPREMEQAARALSSLTRTLRELNGLLGQRQATAGDDAAADDDMPADIDAFRLDLARRINAFVASRTGKTDGGANSET